MDTHVKTLTFEHAAAVLTLAFSADPPVRWMFPDPCQYVAQFPRFIRALAGRAFEQNSADSLDGCPAVALWIPPGVQPDEQSLVALVQESVSEQRQEDTFAIFEEMAAFILQSRIGTCRSSVSIRPGREPAMARN